MRKSFADTFLNLEAASCSLTKQLMPEAKPNIFPFWFHFGFRLNQPQEVRKLYDQMQKEKVLIEKPIYEEEQFVSFRCLDPDEYKIEVYWEKEG